MRNIANRNFFIVYAPLNETQPEPKTRQNAYRRMLVLGGHIGSAVGPYRPRIMKTPAAMARIAITLPSPEKLNLSSGISPVKISQTANNSIPTFRVIFIFRIL